MWLGHRQRKETYVSLRVSVSGGWPRALAGQVERGQRGVVGVERGQLVTVDGGGGVGPQGAGRGQRGPHAAAQAIRFTLSPLVLDGRL